jgi:hypothetical protein
MTSSMLPFKDAAVAIGVNMVIAVAPGNDDDHRRRRGLLPSS